METVPPVQTPEPRREPAADTPAPAELPPEEQQEADVRWGAYSGWAMVPSFLVCAVITAGVIGVWLAWVEFQLSALQARYSAYGVIGLLWAVQLGRWLYRILTQTYRLTTRRLYLERTFFHVPARIVELGRITDVKVEALPLERKLRVGRVHLRTDNPEQPVLTLEGVYDPDDLAAHLRELAKQNRRPA